MGRDGRRRVGGSEDCKEVGQQLAGEETASGVVRGETDQYVCALMA